MEVEHLIRAKTPGNKNTIFSILLISLLFISVTAGAFYMGKTNRPTQSDILSATVAATPVSTTAPITIQPTIPPSPLVVTPSPSPTGKPPTLPTVTPTPKVTPAIP